MSQYSYTSYRSTRRPQPPPPRRRRWLPLVILLFVGITSLVYGGKVAVNAMVREVRHNTEQAQAEKKRLADAKQKEQVQALVAQYPNIDISVALIDLKNGEQKQFGSTEPFVGASTTKVLVAIAYLHEVEQGNKSLTKKIGTLTAQQHLQQMITKSNNASWELLVSSIGREKLQAFGHAMGLSTYKTGYNVITAADEALLLQKLYKGTVLNPEHTKLLLSYMQNTNNEELIPPAVPAGATVYHKFGLLGSYLHDAAIVRHNDREVALVIYTNGADMKDYKQRTQLFHALTKLLLSEPS